MAWTLGSVPGLRGSTTSLSSTDFIRELHLCFARSLNRRTYSSAGREASIRFPLPAQVALIITTDWRGTWSLMTQSP